MLSKLADWIPETLTFLTHDQASHCLSTSHTAEACGERPSPRRQSLANKFCTKPFSSFHQENRCPLECWTQTPEVNRMAFCGHRHVGLWVELPARKTWHSHIEIAVVEFVTLGRICILSSLITRVQSCSIAPASSDKLSWPSWHLCPCHK